MKKEADSESTIRDSKIHESTLLEEENEEMKEETIFLSEAQADLDEEMDNQSSSSYYSNSSEEVRADESPLKYPPMFKERIMVKSASNEHNMTHNITHQLLMRQ